MTRCLPAGLVLMPMALLIGCSATTTPRPEGPAGQPSGGQSMELPPPVLGSQLMELVNLEPLAVEGPVPAKSFLGRAKANLELREGPGIDFAEISQLGPGEGVFVFALEARNGFLHVIRIETDEEGWVHQDSVRIESEIPRNRTSVFTPTGTIDQTNPEVEVWNNTDRTMTVALNESLYHLEPRERRTMSVPPGLYAYRASAPGLIPYLGSEVLAASTGYSWEFYRKTTQ